MRLTLTTLLVSGLFLAPVHAQDTNAPAPATTNSAPAAPAQPTLTPPQEPAAPSAPVTPPSAAAGIAPAPAPTETPAAPAPAPEPVTPPASSTPAPAPAPEPAPVVAPTPAPAPAPEPIAPAASTPPPAPAPAPVAPPPAPEPAPATVSTPPPAPVHHQTAPVTTTTAAKTPATQPASKVPHADHFYPESIIDRCTDNVTLSQERFKKIFSGAVVEFTGTVADINHNEDLVVFRGGGVYPQNWDVQLKPHGQKFKVGHTYKVTFRLTKLRDEPLAGYSFRGIALQRSAVE